MQMTLDVFMNLEFYFDGGKKRFVIYNCNINNLHVHVFQPRANCDFTLICISWNFELSRSPEFVLHVYIYVGDSLRCQGSGVKD